jgi:hypothetical protein
MLKVIEAIQSLENDEAFEAAFPILCYSFIDVKNKVNEAI